MVDNRASYCDIYSKILFGTENIQNIHNDAPRKLNMSQLSNVIKYLDKLNELWSTHKMYSKNSDLVIAFSKATPTTLHTVIQELNQIGNKRTRYMYAHSFNHVH